MSTEDGIYGRTIRGVTCADCQLRCLPNGFWTENARDREPKALAISLLELLNAADDRYAIAGDTPDSATALTDALEAFIETVAVLPDVAAPGIFHEDEQGLARLFFSPAPTSSRAAPRTERLPEASFCGETSAVVGCLRKVVRGQCHIDDRMGNCPDAQALPIRFDLIGAGRTLREYACYANDAQLTTIAERLWPYIEATLNDRASNPNAALHLPELESIEPGMIRGILLALAALLTGELGGQTWGEHGEAT